MVLGVIPLNVWALDKDKSIKHALLLLQNHLGETAFIIEESSMLHSQAVFLRHRYENDVRLYLYTLGQPENRYGVHLEYPEAMIYGPYIDAYENLSLRSLVEILAVHFDIANIVDLHALC